jgi:hypothetical protein
MREIIVSIYFAPASLPITIVQGDPLKFVLTTAVDSQVPFTQFVRVAPSDLDRNLVIPLPGIASVPKKDAAG